MKVRHRLAIGAFLLVFVIVIVSVNKIYSRAAIYAAIIDDAVQQNSVDLVILPSTLDDIKVIEREFRAISKSHAVFFTDREIESGLVKVKYEHGAFFQLEIERYGWMSVTVRRTGKPYPISGTVYSLYLERKGGRWHVVTRDIVGVR